MAKQKAKWIRLVNSVDSENVNSFTLPTVYTAQNYTPTPVGSEAEHMLSAHLNGIDIKLGTLLTAIATFSDQITAYDGDDSVFLISNSFSTDTLIDWWVDGQLRTENLDFLRDAGANTISNFIDLVIAPIPGSGEVRTRLYDEGFTFTEDTLTGDNTFSTFNPSNITITTINDLELVVNGLVYRENTASAGRWTRNVGLNQISFFDEDGTTPLKFPTDAEIRLRESNITSNREYFTGTATLKVLSGVFEETTKIDVYIDGKLATESIDWSRDSILDNITWLSGSLTADSLITVKVWSV